MDEQKRKNMIKVSIIGIVFGLFLAIFFLGMAADMEDSYKYYLDSDYQDSVKLFQIIGYLGVLFAVLDSIQLTAYAVAGEQETSDGNLIKCTDCGKMISRNASVCPKCGAPNHLEVQNASVPPKEIDSVLEMEIKQKMITCPRCGKICMEGAAFCGNCGTKL